MACTPSWRSDMTAARICASSSGISTAPRESNRSRIPMRRRRGATNVGVSGSMSRSYMRERFCRPSSSTSSKPSVVRTAVTAPFCSSTALVATVVPWMNRWTSPADASARVSTRFTAVRMPSSRSLGVLGTFVSVSRPSSSRATMSVNVPPMSTPICTRAASRSAGRLYRSCRPRTSTMPRCGAALRPIARTARLGDELVGRVPRREWTELLCRRAGPDREVALNLSAETIEVGLEDRQLLGVRQRSEAIPLDALASAERDFSARLGVPHPLRVAPRRDQEQPAILREHVHGQRVELPCLAATDLQHAHVRKADPETHQRTDRSIEQALETGRLLERTGWLSHRTQDIARRRRSPRRQRCRIDRMRSASRTAELVALYRAIESSRSAATRLFVDPLAPLFLRPRFRWALRASHIPAIGAAMPWSIVDGHWSGPRGTVAVRTRYIDDVLGAALRGGAEQVVILGAGFDCRAYRIPDIARTRVFEVDHPATQAKKTAVITRQLSAMPPHVTLVPADFSTDSLDTVMPRSGYRRDAVTLFICEGVTHYLSLEAVDTIFRHVVDNAPAGSQTVFTYIHRGLLDGSVSFAGGNDTLTTVRRVGEPYTFGFDPAALPRHLSPLGLEMIEDVGASQYRQPCLQARGRAGERLAELQRAPVAQVTHERSVEPGRHLAHPVTREYCALAASHEEDAMVPSLQD